MWKFLERNPEIAFFGLFVGAGMLAGFAAFILELAKILKG